MHICFIGEIATPSVKTGGIGSFVANLIPELLQKGVSVSVISYKQQTKPLEIEQADGFTIYWINTHQWGPMRFYKKIADTNALLKRIHGQNPIHLVESSEAGFFLVKKIRGIKYIIRLHGGHVFFANSTADTPFSRKKAWMEKLSLQKADAIIGVSKYVLDTTAITYPFIRRVPNEIIHNPIVLERFYASDPTKPKKGSILFLGSLTEKKGIRQLIDSMPLVWEKYPQAHLQVYGRDVAMRPSGNSFKAVLAAMIQKMLKAEQITLHDPIPNLQMPAVIEAAELVVLPSHMEAMPLAWLEAMAMEKPFIAGRPGPGPEVVNHMKNGLLCDPFDPSDIAEKIIYMLAHPEEAKAMGQQARRDIIAGFGSTFLADRNLNFFRLVLSGTQQ